MAIWQDYKVLVLHLEEAKNDKNRDKKERCTYKGLLRKVTSVESNVQGFLTTFIHLY
jgi:hypothetical protein